MRPADLARNIARDIKRPMLGEQTRHMGKVYLLPVDLCKKREKRSSYCLIYVRSAGEERLAIWTIKLSYGQTNSDHKISAVGSVRTLRLFVLQPITNIIILALQLN
jgi:hypothetical protein